MIHEYFKKDFGDYIIIVQLNPETYEGVELYIEGENIEQPNLQFDKDIYGDFEVDGFHRSSPLEFNLFLNGIR